MNNDQNNFNNQNNFNDQNNFNQGYDASQNGGTGDGWSYGNAQPNGTNGRFYNDGRPYINNTGFGNGTFYQQPQSNNQATATASSAQTLGVVGLILALVCCPLIGLILGIMALNRAKSATAALGYEPPEAKTGRICGIIAIVAGAISMVTSLLASILNVTLFMDILGSAMSLTQFFL